MKGTTEVVTTKEQNMYDLNHDVLEALKATPETLAGLLARVSETQARAAKGGDENWSVVQVVCHLREAEEFFLKRMRAMRDQDNPMIAAYDQEALACERNYTTANLQEAMAAFSAFRSQSVAEISKLSPDAWQRPGRHNELGEITIFAMAVHHVAHDAIHCAQIARQMVQF
jgi:hypothetical protein